MNNQLRLEGEIEKIIKKQIDNLPTRNGYYCLSRDHDSPVFAKAITQHILSTFPEEIEQSIKNLNHTQCQIIKDGIDQFGHIGEFGRRFIINSCLSTIKKKWGIDE